MYIYTYNIPVVFLENWYKKLSRHIFAIHIGIDVQRWLLYLNLAIAVADRKQHFSSRIKLVWLGLMLMLEVFFPAKVASVGAGILTALAWLACFLGCSIVGAFLGECHWILGLFNV